MSQSQLVDVFNEEVGMFNPDAKEKAFHTWLKKVDSLLGRALEMNELRGIAWDMFADGCTPESAAYEICNG